MRFHKKPFEPNSYSIERALLSLSPVPSFSLALTAMLMSREEELRREVRRRERSGRDGVNGGYVPIIQTTIVRLSLNDANKFDYFWFQILLLGKWRHHRHHHRRSPPPSLLPCYRAHVKGGNTPENHFPRFEPTAHPPGP